MKHHMIILLFALSILLPGCAEMYKAPPPTAPVTEMEPVTVSGSRDDLFNVAKKVLLREGYVIRYSDVYSGTIMTTGKPVKLEKTMADCGTIAGAPSGQVSNIAAEVAMNLVISDNNIDAKADITAEDIRGNKRHMADIKCISLGSIENDLVRKIADEASK